MAGFEIDITDCVVCCFLADDDDDDDGGSMRPS
jgi:hypothetical protein